MKKSVVFIEVEGGNDKGDDGHRKDTIPMVESLRAKGWQADTVFYHPDQAAELESELIEKHDGYVSRVNPGQIPGGEEVYFNFLRKLSDAGLVGMSHPDDMKRFGAKDSMVMLRGTPLVPDDQFVYNNEADMQKLYETLGMGTRVLKQNRGSTGSGIWRVEIPSDDPASSGGEITPQTKVRCTEAVDNHVENHSVESFIKMCDPYLVGDDGLMVDMPYLPRIVEGEIRILMVGEKPVFVVHKKPADEADAFSATLFSGAKYRYDKPEDWPELMGWFLDSLPVIKEKLGTKDSPLLWTADFILDTDDAGKDTYVLGEINCSCVGFTSHLDMGIQDLVAEEVISRIPT